MGALGSALGLALSLMVIAAAQDIYISPLGSDANNGTAPVWPVASLAQGCALACNASVAPAPCWMVHVLAGAYAGGGNSDVSLGPREISIQAVAGAEVTLAATSSQPLFRLSNTQLTLSGLGFASLDTNLFQGTAAGLVLVNCSSATAPAPSIASVSDASQLPTNGVGAVTITGSGFGTLAEIVRVELSTSNFQQGIDDLYSCDDVVLLSARELTCVPPPATGDAFLHVVVGAAASNSVPVSYASATFISVTPSSGQGGQVVTVFGDHFVDTADLACVFGGHTTVKAQFLSNTLMTCVVPVSDTTPDALTTFGITNDGYRVTQGATIEQAVLWPNLLTAPPRDYAASSAPAAITVAVLLPDASSQPLTPRFLATVQAGFNYSRTSMGLLPYTDVDVVFISTDTNTPQQAVAQALSAGAVAIVGGEGSNSTGEIGEYAAAVSLPQVAFDATALSLSSPTTYPFLWRTIASDSVQMLALVKFITLCGWESVATISTTDEYGRQGMQAFESLASAASIRIKVHLEFDIMQTDLSSLATQLQQSGERVFVMHASGLYARYMLTAANALSLIGPSYAWVGTDGWLSPLVYLQSDGTSDPTLVDLLRGAVGVRPAIGSGPVYEAMLDMVGPTPPGVEDAYPAYVFDAAIALATALDEVIHATRAATNGSAVMEQLRTTDFIGASGDVHAVGLLSNDRGRMSYEVANFNLNATFVRAGTITPNMDSPADSTVAVTMSQIQWRGGYGPAPLDHLYVPPTSVRVLVIGQALLPNGQIDGNGAENFQFALQAVHEINEDNSLLTGIPISVQTLDAASPTYFTDIPTVMSAFKPHAIVGPRTSQSSIDFAPYGAQFQKPFISFSASAPSLSDPAVYPWFLRTVNSDAAQGAALVDMIVSYGWRQIAVLAQNTAYASALGMIVAEQAARQNLKVLAYECFQTDHTGLVEAVTAVKISKATVIVLSSHEDLSQAVISEALSQGLIGPSYAWLGVDGWISGSSFRNLSCPDTCPIISNLASASIGMLGTQFGRGRPESILAALNKTQMVSIYSIYAYEGVYMVAHALHDMIARGDDIENGTLVNAKLRDIEYDGVTGNVQIGAGTNNRVNMPYDIINIRTNATVDVVGKITGRGLYQYTIPESCSPGTYQASQTNRTCVPCAIGTFSDGYGQAVCKQCVYGSPGAVGSYTNTTGQAICTQCPDNTLSNSVTCPCAPTFFYNGDLTGACAACPTGGDCSNGQLSCQPGFWRETVNSTLFYGCPIAAACMGGVNATCEEGYTGILCGSCAPQYGRWDVSCVFCSAGMQAVSILLFIALFGIFLGYTIFQLRKPLGKVFREFEFLLPVLISHIQVLALLRGVTGSASSGRANAFANFLQILGLAVDAEIIAGLFACAVEMRYYTSFTLSMVVYLGMPIVFPLAVFVLRKILMKFRGGKRESEDEFRIRVQRSIIKLSLFVHPIIAKKCAEAVNCRKVGDAYYLVADLETRCFTAAHTALIVVAAVIFAAFVIGLPVLLIAHQLRNRAVLQESNMLSRYFVMYGGYRQERFYWWTMPMIRKLAVALLVVFLRDNVYLAIQLVLLALMLSMLLHFSFTPFLTSVMNGVEGGSLLTLWFTMFLLSLQSVVGLVPAGSGITAAVEPNVPEGVLITVLLIFVNVIAIGGIIFAMLTTAVPALKKKLRPEGEAEKQLNLRARRSTMSHEMFPMPAEDVNKQ